MTTDTNKTLNQSAQVSTKRIAKNSLFLYLRMGLVMIVSFISVRILLKELGIVDYGVYNAIGGVVTSLAFISTVLANASQRYFSYSIGQKDLNSLNQNFGSILLVYFLIIILILAISETIGVWFVENKMNYESVKVKEVLWVFQFSLFTIILHLLSSPFLAMLIAHEDMNDYAIISICESILKLIAVLLLSLFSTARLVVYPILLTTISLMVLTIYIFSIKRKYPYLKIKFSYNRLCFFNILSYSGWSCFGAVAGVGYNQGINILFNIFIGPLANAAFAIANQVSAAITTFGTSFFTAVRPGIVKYYAQGEIIKLNNLYLFSSKMLFLLLYLIILPLLFQTNTVLSLWLGTPSEYMIQFTRMLLISCLIAFLGLPITTIMQAAGRVKIYHLVVDGFLVCSISVVFFFFKKGLDAVDILWIINIMYIIAYMLRLVCLKKIITFSISSYLRCFLIPITGVILLTSISMWVINNYLYFMPIIELLINIFISTFIILFISYVLLFTKSDRIKLFSLVLKKR